MVSKIIIFKFFGVFSRSSLCGISSKVLYTSNIDKFKNDASDDADLQKLALKIIFIQRKKELFLKEIIFFKIPFKQKRSINKYSLDSFSALKDSIIVPSELIQIAFSIFI